MCLLVCCCVFVYCDNLFGGCLFLNMYCLCMFNGE